MKFRMTGETTLNELLQEMEKSNATAIKRIIQDKDGLFSVEFGEEK